MVTFFTAYEWGRLNLMLFSCFFLVFSCFSVFSRAGSSHPVVLFSSEEQKVTFWSLCAKRHYRVRGSDAGKYSFLVFSRVFLLFPDHLSGLPTHQFEEKCSKGGFSSEKSSFGGSSSN